MVSVLGVEVKRYDPAGAVFVLGGIVGVGVHAGLFNRVGMGPLWVFPYFLGIWLAMFTTIFGVQLFYLQRKTFDTRREWIADMFYYVFETTVAFLLMVGYFVGYRIDGGLWSIFLLACLALNVHAVYRARSQVVQPTEAAAEEAKVPEVISTEQSSAARCGVRTLQGFNTALRVIAFLMLGLLLGGCWTQAVGYRMYPPRGVFVPLTYPTGQVQNVHVWCTGERNASLPTFWFEIGGGGGHSMSDVYGLQFALNALGRRVCQYDVPGAGWTDFAIPDQPAITQRLIDALGEPGPFIMLGTMNTGPERIYEYALSNPHNVRALVPIQYSTVGEFRPMQMVNGWTEAQTLQEVQRTMSGRRGLGELIVAIAVQWGLMPVFAPLGNDYTPADLQREMLFLNLYNEKQWTTQVDVLTGWQANPSLLLQPSAWANRTLAPHIPVIAFDVVANTTRACEQQMAAPDSTRCEIIKLTATLSSQSMFNMTTMTAGSAYVPCNNCTGFMTAASNLPLLVQGIMTHLGDIRLP